MDDAQGRWFKFTVSGDTVMLLEKAGLPEHLHTASVVDRPSFLRKMLVELEDAGEANGELVCMGMV